MNPPVHAPTQLVVGSGWQWGFGIFHFAVAGLVIYLFARGRRVSATGPSCGSGCSCWSAAARGGVLRGRG